MALVPLNPPAAEAFARRTAWNGSAGLKYWHLASVDAPTVAAVWACAFAWAARVRVAPGMVAVLALVVWTIYVIDRLLDARAVLRGAGLGHAGRHRLQERHWFHWRHRRVLGGMAAVAAMAAGWMILSRLHAAALGRDSLVGLAALAYFSGVHGGEKPKWAERLSARAERVISRELLVGVIFSAGCVLPVLPSAWGVDGVCARLATPAAAFAAVAWLNVKAIDCWEQWAAGVRPERDVRRTAFWLAGLSGGCGVAAWGMEPRMALLMTLAAGSALLLAWLDGARERMDAVTLRAAADLVLLTPVVVLIPAALMR